MDFRHPENESSAFEIIGRLIMPRKKKREVICVYHAQIKQALFDIENCMQRTDSLAMKDAVMHLRTAQEAVKLAFLAGQSMEDRLREYRTAIEALGFQRNKK